MSSGSHFNASRDQVPHMDSSSNPSSDEEDETPTTQVDHVHAAPTASEPDTRKKARFDPSVAPPGQIKGQSPLLSAQTHITNHIESLHDGIATLLLARGKEHLALVHKIFIKDSNIARMEKDDEYIPISARINFRLQAIPAADELQEYKALKEETATLVSTQQKGLKAAIIKCAKLERGILQQNLDRHYCESIHSVTSLFHIVQGKADKPVGDTVAHLFTKHGDALLKHSTLTSTAHMVLYRELFNIPDIDDSIVIDASHGIAISRAIESVFLSSWDCYLSQAKANDLALTLKKCAKSTLLERKTEDVVMLVDDEVPTDRAQLNALIKKEANLLARGLIKTEVASQLKNATKNQKRGPKGKGASQKNKSRSNSPKPKKKPGKGSGTTTKRNSTPNRTDRKDEDSANGSKKGKKKSQNNRSKKRSTQKPSDTKPRRKRS